MDTVYISMAQKEDMQKAPSDFSKSAHIIPIQLPTQPYPLAVLYCYLHMGSHT